MEPFTSALALARAIRNRDLSPVEAVESCLARLDAHDGDLNSIIWRRDEAVLAEARAAEAAVMRGDALPPFHGVPIPIKDLTEVAGQPWMSGSRATLDRVGRFDAPVVGRMREAGFLFIGRSNSPEFGTLPVTENAAFGATRNPWNKAHTPGGSSGGAAAAVAAGLVPIAHASDGGGSIRIPAACTGLVGLKPSRGRIPRGPIVSDVLHGFSQDGCLATNVADAAAYLDAVAHNLPNAWHNAPLPAKPFVKSLVEKAPKLRIGFTTQGPVPAAPAPHIVQAMEKTAALLESFGHSVFPAMPEPWKENPRQVGDDFITMWASGMVYADPIDWSRAEPHNRKLLDRSRLLSTYDYVKALVRLHIFASRVLMSWGKDFDLLLTPTLAIDPPKIGWLGIDEAVDPVALLWRCTDMVPYSGWCNVSGQPAISLPVATSPSGLPVGVHLAAAPWREDLLLQVAAQLEGALGWQKKLPIA
jgi:amidase